jgi:hypothetical protein
MTLPLAVDQRGPLDSVVGSVVILDSWSWIFDMRCSKAFLSMIPQSYKAHQAIVSCKMKEPPQTISSFQALAPQESKAVLGTDGYRM